ncbi:M23 family metallopeptidase [Streptomyces sp. NBC_00879]|nr:M23 family metallopeptidase [Streptomyces sp. NBC_00879]
MLSLAWASTGPARAGDSRGRSWPLGPPRPVVVRGWESPASAYGAGHRGVDLAAPPGTEIRAAAPGRVSFAGRVAGRGVLSVTLTGTGDPPLRTTYEPVRPLLAEGAEVSAGQVVATMEAGPSHCASGCLHWGLLRGREYLDPLSLLPPWLLRRPPSRLLPVFGVPALESTAAVDSRAVRAPVHAPVLAGAGGALHAVMLAVTAAVSQWVLRRGRATGPRGPGCAGPTA